MDRVGVEPTTSVDLSRSCLISYIGMEELLKRSCSNPTRSFF
jgi:hypothetical protein